MEIVYKNYISFNILGDEINVISDLTEYGINTIIEANNQYYYLGPEPGNLESAMFVWQDLNQRDLTLDEFNQVVEANSHLTQ